MFSRLEIYYHIDSVKIRMQLRHKHCTFTVAINQIHLVQQQYKYTGTRDIITAR